MNPFILGCLVLLSAAQLALGQDHPDNWGVFGRLERQSVGPWDNAFNPNTAFETGTDLVDGQVVRTYACRILRNAGNTPDGYVLIGAYNPVRKCCAVAWFAFDTGCVASGIQFMNKNNPKIKQLSWVPASLGKVDLNLHKGLVIVGSVYYSDQYVCRMKYVNNGVSTNLQGKWNPGANACWGAFSSGDKGTWPVKGYEYELLRADMN